MNIIFSTIIAIIILLLFVIFVAWIDKFNAKDKLAFIEKTIDRKEAFIDKAIEKVLDKVSTTGPWYLVVYTQDSNYPIWISHNTIRSIHPDPKNYKLIIKQFNGEGVIENVESYELCSASDLCDYDM